MPTRSSRLRRTLAAVLLATTATTAAGCGVLRKVMPGGGAPALDAMQMADHARARDALRDKRARAALALRDGRRADYSAADALALSTAEQALDGAAAWTARPAPGRATFADLPRKHWWYLFVEPAQWAKGPLVVDRERSPGFYAAMMNAFDQVLAAAPSAAAGAAATGGYGLAAAGYTPAAGAMYASTGPVYAAAAAATTAAATAIGGVTGALGVDDYLAMHQLVSLGVFAKADGRPEAQGFVTAPMTYAIAPLHDPDATSRDQLARSLAEMKAEGLAGWNPEFQRMASNDALTPWLAALLDGVTDVNPHSKPAKLVFAAERGIHGEAMFAQWLRASNSFAPGEARTWVAQWLAAYADEQKATSSYLTGASYLDALNAIEPSEAMLAAVRPVCRLIRRLQVTHVFASASERLDTRLLLNKLLVAQGLPPAVIRDASLFAGRAPLDALAREVIDGQKQFQRLVIELAAREAAPVAAP